MVSMFYRSLNILIAVSALASAQLPRIAYDVNLTHIPISENYKAVETKSGALSKQDSITRNQVELLKYYKVLGYSHVFFYVLAFNEKSLFNNGVWKYNNGSYSSGVIAENFRRQKAAFEHYGLKIVPKIPSGLTYMVPYINADPRVGEFYDPTKPNSSSLSDYLQRNGLDPNIPDRFAYVGNYPKIRNYPVDQIVSEALKIINANWGNSSLGGRYPKYIHIGHDENGSWTHCMIAEGRAKIHLNSKTTRSDLVAREIAFRYKQIQNTVKIRRNKRISVILYGDSYLPADWGEIYGLCGNPSTGAAQGSMPSGVLHKIRYNRYIKKNISRKLHPIYPTIVVMPWQYSIRDGYYRGTGTLYPRNSSDRIFNKSIQLSYLTKLGYRFMPMTGESGNISSSSHTERVKQTMYEWMRASQMFPSKLAGYSYSMWLLRYSYGNGGPIENPAYFADITDPSSLKGGYSASLLAYCAWQFPQKNYFTSNYYEPGFFANCKYRESRNNTSWISGIDYLPFRRSSTPMQRTIPVLMAR